MAVHVGECAVLVWAPFRKVGEIIDDAPGIGVEDVRPVAVYQNAVFVVLVVCVAPDVRALVDHTNLFSGARQALCYDATGIAGAHDQDVGLHATPSHRSNKWPCRPCPKSRLRTKSIKSEAKSRTATWCNPAWSGVRARTLLPLAARVRRLSRPPRVPERENQRIRLVR